MAQKYLDETGLGYVWGHVKDHVKDCRNSKTYEAVEVNGGPLAGLTTNWPWKEDGKNIIPANLSMQEFIAGLYLKVMNGTLGNPSYTWNPTLTNKPTASMTKTGTVEIGESCTVTFGTQTGVSKNNHAVSVDAFDNDQAKSKFGYMIDAGTEWNKADYSQSVACTADETGLAATATIKKGSATAVAINSGDSFYVKEGTNTLTASQSGTVCTRVDLTPHTLYAVTNTGVKLPDVSKAITANGGNFAATKTPTATTETKSVTGARAYWYGFLNTAPSGDDLTNEYFRAITTGPSTAANGVGKTLTALNTGSSIQAQAGFLGLIIAVPATRTITSVKQDGAPTELIDSKNLKTISIEAANGQDATNYKVYYWTWAAGGSKTKWILTIS